MKKGILSIVVLLISALLIVTGSVVFANDVVDTSTEVKNNVLSVVVEKEEIVKTSNTDNTQKIAVIWKDDISKLNNVRLVYKNSNNQEKNISEKERTDSSILFEKDFTTEDTGNYNLIGIRYFINGDVEEKFFKFNDKLIDAEFRIVEPTSIVKTESDETPDEIVSVNYEDENHVADAVNNVMTTANVPKLLSSGSGIVITLDPGHSGNDPGACYYGIEERDLNWEITMACKAELEEYGVKVIVVREKNGSAADPSADAATELEKRAQIAADNKSNLLVSIHNNALGNGSAQGFMIFYPYDCSYQRQTHVIGKSVAEKVQAELKTLGLVDNGIKVKEDTDPEPERLYYPTGENADWYGIIRRCRSKGVPAILIEHAFMDNSHDIALLKNPDFLKKLGIADATGIAKYYGLSKKTPEAPIEPAVDEELVAPETGDITSEEYTIGKYITGVDRKTSYKTLKEKLTAGSGLTFKAVNKDGEELTDSSIIGTGTKINIYNGNDVKASILVCIRGDLNGDGLALASDAILTLKTAVNLYSSNSVQTAAVDINGNGKLEAADAIRILKYASNLDTLDEDNRTMIMGATLTNRDQLARYYRSKAGENAYPSYYSEAKTDAPDLETFCQIYIEEAAAEGVRAEVAFAQAMKETGWLRYGGQVKKEQLNFAGLGATDGGATGATFTSVRQGVRAQIQHLKAYACTDALANSCVDPRFNLVSPRGCAPYVEWLGINENPNKKGWATDSNYGYDIVSKMNTLLSM